MKECLIVGAGRGGTALLEVLHRFEKIKVRGIVDINQQAPGLLLAQNLGVPYGSDFMSFLHPDIDFILEATGVEEVFIQLQRLKGPKTVLIPGTIANIIMALIDEKEQLIKQLERQKTERDTILNSTHDGMIAVNEEGSITLFNRSAEKLMGISSSDVLGTLAFETIPNSRLHVVLETGKPELNQEQVLSNQMRIVTNRVPMKDDDGNIVGAVAVFRDITELMDLAAEVTNLKDIQSLLEAIIQSSEDAISVVDAEGKGLIINPAYTRLTGLTAEDVIGKPADVDISEGVSMHMQVLKTKKPVRGVPLKVGPNRKDVLVNVAPILVDGVLKGSVGVIHDTSEIKKLTAELEKAKQIIRTLEAKYTFDDIIGESEEMRYAFEQAKNAASTHVTILLRGESGTGKELFAHAIHNASDRKYNQFVRVNCAAISESLLESELFGYEEGAFTGARRGGKRGLFEEASGGTIFLDEIGEISPNIQAKLLRVLQEKEIIRVGGTKPVPVNVRVIAATNVNLEKAIQQGTFREDLYYRLNVMPIIIPPLRYRKEDFSKLSHHIIRKFNQEFGRNVESIDEDALNRMKNYPWPGNVRELENVLGRAMINMRFNERVIKTIHLPPIEGQSIHRSSSSVQITEDFHTDLAEPLDKILENVEKAYIEKVLSATGGNRTKAAKILGISIRSLYYKLEKLKITH
ncbi:sigma 54-interacting transcriptional regulator [Microaerobacter geothermalis]|uniref:sigma-54 interaction domain-containing protein n=1 Tax=Microaerobacter geothermalis TaxID=674972 RepID=UPI001F1A4994|nr:sigma-54-dependent Fis family transcriptional regulator [Microaerobacter geothermalis]MCF6094425.1 sigma 54-interacting transcriptional regulator [Microaerobacter geothermalis]